MGKIRIAIVGVGNCASSLVQGIDYYRYWDKNAQVPGLMHANLGGYGIGDIEPVAAFDVAKSKVGKDLHGAIFESPNNTEVFSAPPEPSGVRVHRGPTFDGIGKYLREMIEESPEPEADVVRVLKDAGTQVVVNYLPVGSEKASWFYATAARAASCAFVNCIPVFIASDSGRADFFRKDGLPIIGDDVKSQVGATIVHRVLTHLFAERGVRLDRTYQLNFGGNTDFLNMLERERLESKKISKTQAVTSQLGDPLPADCVHVGPSDYVPWLGDKKMCHIRMEATTFGGVPLLAEVKLEVIDSPNSAGVVVDAIRCAKIALDRGIGGPLEAPSAYLMKSPPRQFADDEARELLETWVRQPSPR